MLFTMRNIRIECIYYGEKDIQIRASYKKKKKKHPSVGFSSVLLLVYNATTFVYYRENNTIFLRETVQRKRKRKRSSSNAHLFRHRRGLYLRDVSISVSSTVQFPIRCNDERVAYLTILCNNFRLRRDNVNN